MSDVSLASPGPVRQTLNVGEIVKEIGPDFEPSRIIYWSDLLVSTFVGWSALIISVRAPFGSPLHVVATLVAIFAVLRAALFIHELSHLKRGQMPGFELVDPIEIQQESKYQDRLAVERQMRASIARGEKGFE